MGEHCCSAVESHLNLELWVFADSLTHPNYLALFVFCWVWSSVSAFHMVFACWPWWEVWAWRIAVTPSLSGRDMGTRKLRASAVRNLLWSFSVLLYGLQRRWENTSHTARDPWQFPTVVANKTHNKMELCVCWRRASWLQPDLEWALIVLWLFLVALNLVAHCKLALWWQCHLKNRYRFRFDSSIVAVLLPLTYCGAPCEHLLGWLCPPQMFPETGDDFKIKDSLQQLKKTFSRLFCVCVC